MAIVVQKHGGTSVGEMHRLKRVADRVARTHRAGNQVVVVVSAIPEMSFTGSQAGIITDRSHGRARIIDMTPGRVRGTAW